MTHRELRELAEKQRLAYERMVELDGGIGRLGIEHPEMFEDMRRWADFTRNDFADVVLALLSELDHLTTVAEGRRVLGIAAIFLTDVLPLAEVEAARRDYLATEVEKAATWLEEIRHDTWNGGARRPSNYGRAAGELRQYAAGMRAGR